jgi:hypothetical protein
VAERPYFGASMNFENFETEVGSVAADNGQVDDGQVPDT